MDVARRRDVGGGASGGPLLLRHLSFLAGVLALDSVAGAAAGPPASADVVASTVRLVLGAVLRRLERCCRDDEHGDVVSQSAAVHALDVVARVADVADSAALCEVVGRFARTVVDSVMSSQLLNQVRLSQLVSLAVIIIIARKKSRTSDFSSAEWPGE